MQVTLSEEKNEYCNYIKMCMIFKRCIYYILLLLYDFEWGKCGRKKKLKLDIRIHHLTRTTHINQCTNISPNFI